MTGATFGAGTWLVGAIGSHNAVALGGISLVGCFVAAYDRRAQQGGDPMLGALSDVSGFTAISTAIHQRDPVSGEARPLTPFWRGYNATVGGSQLFLSAQATINGVQKALTVPFTPGGGGPALAFAGVPGTASAGQTFVLSTPVVGATTIRLGLSEINVYMTAGDANSSDPQDNGGPTTPPTPPPDINEEHIFNGEINNSGKAVGFHHRPGGQDPAGAKMTTQTQAPDANGIYKGEVEIYDASRSEWVEKELESSFFPDSWSRQQVLDEILGAFENATISGSGWQGTSPSGIRIKGWLDSVTGAIRTAYPIRQP